MIFWREWTIDVSLGVDGVAGVADVHPVGHPMATPTENSATPCPPHGHPLSTPCIFL